MVDVVICGGFSPGARVLRAAVRNLSRDHDLCIITLTPALVGIKQSLEEVDSLDPNNTLVIDGCEGGCAIQSLMKLGKSASRSLLLKKYPSVNEKNIAEAEISIRCFLEGR